MISLALGATSKTFIEQMDQGKLNESQVLPVITLYQPWASWIMRLWKTIETREHNRFACLNGKRILIHAGQRTDASPFATQNPFLSKEQIFHNPDEIINGFILGSAYVSNVGWLDASHSSKALIDCHHTSRFGLFLEWIIPEIEPIPVKGEMGIWYYDLSRKEKVKKPNVEIMGRAQQTSLWD